jgi:hypothetical protein
LLPSTLKVLLRDVAPVTPKVLLITVTPALSVATYALFVEMLLVEMLLAVIKLVLTVPPTLRPPESVSEPTVSVVIYALLVEIELV